VDERSLYKNSIKYFLRPVLTIFQLYRNLYLKQFILSIFFVHITLNTYGQEKQKIFINENGKEIKEQTFYNAIKSIKKRHLYFENDTLQYHVIFLKEKYGQLSKKELITLKSYLLAVSGRKIDSTENIVINYLTASSSLNESSNYGKSNWNILDRNYLRKLHKIANINQFWFHSSITENLKYYHQKRINWIVDKDNLLKRMFFPFETPYENYLLIKPNGAYYYYIGEYSKFEVWKKCRAFFNL